MACLRAPALPARASPATFASKTRKSLTVRSTGGARKVSTNAFSDVNVVISGCNALAEDRRRERICDLCGSRQAPQRLCF